MIKRILISILLLSFTSVNAINCVASTPIDPDSDVKSPFSEFYFGIGLSGTQFLKDSPSAKPISYTSEENDYVIGGSFDGIESGIHISIMTNLTESSDLMLPISFEYDWLKSGEEMYPESRTRWQIQHSIDIQKIGTGLQWQFLTFPFKDVKAYMEADIKGIFINQQNFNQISTVKQSDGTTTVTKSKYSPKETAIRLGAEYKLGFRGQLAENLYINSFLGFEVINLLGRDNARGELLTPFGAKTQNVTLLIPETKEQYVANFHFVLMIEYKL